jgi:hypothetical protein
MNEYGGNMKPSERTEGLLDVGESVCPCVRVVVQYLDELDEQLDERNINAVRLISRAAEASADHRRALDSRLNDTEGRVDKLAARVQGLENRADCAVSERMAQLDRIKELEARATAPPEPPQPEPEPLPDGWEVYTRESGDPWFRAPNGSGGNINADGSFSVYTTTVPRIVVEALYRLHDERKRDPVADGVSDDRQAVQEQVDVCGYLGRHIQGKRRQ